MKHCRLSLIYYLQNQTPKCKFQQSNLSEIVKTVESYERFVGPPGSVATPFALILMTNLCDIKGLPINVRGLNKSLKRRAVFRWLHHQNSSFIFLQETYSLKECENIWRAEWGGEIVVNRGTNQSKGTMILFHPNLNFKIEKQITDRNGRNIISSYCVIVRVRVVLKRTVVGD